MTPKHLTGRALEGWLDEPWAKKGESRTVFFQRVITRFCPDFIEPLLERATQDFITVGYDFWSDPGITNSIYRAFATLLAFDWTIVGLIASQDGSFVQRLNRQSRHEFFRAKKFLEHFSQLCEYRNLRLKANSERLNVSTGYIPFYYKIYFSRLCWLIKVFGMVVFTTLLSVMILTFFILYWDNISFVAVWLKSFLRFLIWHWLLIIH